jgi:hypothetical protein
MAEAVVNMLNLIQETTPDAISPAIEKRLAEVQEAAIRIVDDVADWKHAVRLAYSERRESNQVENHNQLRTFLVPRFGSHVPTRLDDFVAAVLSIDGCPLGDHEDLADFALEFFGISESAGEVQEVDSEMKDA